MAIFEYLCAIVFCLLAVHQLIFCLLVFLFSFLFSSFFICLFGCLPVLLLFFNFSLCRFVPASPHLLVCTADKGERLVAGDAAHVVAVHLRPRHLVPGPISAPHPLAKRSRCLVIGHGDLLHGLHLFVTTTATCQKKHTKKKEENEERKGKKEKNKTQKE
jgi:hypothetical protein